jgi:hypothetical protein
MSGTISQLRVDNGNLIVVIWPAAWPRPIRIEAAGEPLLAAT